MDIKKLMEDGRRLIDLEIGDIRLADRLSRAVLALALRAAAEEAADHAAADMAYAIKYPDETQRMGERAHRARTISNRLRTLAAQLGGSDA
jgi:hypothetical protein